MRGSSLIQKNVKKETVDGIFKTLDDSEMALFSPSSEGDMQKNYDAAVEIISKLETELRG